MMKLKVGNIVLIDPDGRYSHQASQSAYSEGEISTIDPYDGDYCVDFENGYHNCYTIEDLIFIRNNKTNLPDWKKRIGVEE